jgi:hypothetical protein
MSASPLLWDEEGSLRLICLARAAAYNKCKHRQQFQCKAFATAKKNCNVSVSLALGRGREPAPHLSGQGSCVQYMQAQAAVSVQSVCYSQKKLQCQRLPRSGTRKGTCPTSVWPGQLRTIDASTGSSFSAKRLLQPKKIAMSASPSLWDEEGNLPNICLARAAAYNKCKHRQQFQR